MAIYKLSQHWNISHYEKQLILSFVEDIGQISRALTMFPNWFVRIQSVGRALSYRYIRILAYICIFTPHIIPYVCINLLIIWEFLQAPFSKQIHWTSRRRWNSNWSDTTTWLPVRQTWRSISSRKRSITAIRWISPVPVSLVLIDFKI